MFFKLLFVLLLGAPTPQPKPLTALEKKLETRFGRGFAHRLRLLGCSPKRYVYALKLTKVGLTKLVDAEYDDALFLFKKAYSIVKSPHLFFYRAMAYKGMGRLVRARVQFRAFLSAYPTWSLTKVSPRRVARAKREIQRLEQDLAALTIETNSPAALITIDGQPMGKTPLFSAIWLLPGRVSVVVSKRGHVSHRLTLTLKRGERVQRQLRLITTQALLEQNRRRIQAREMAKARANSLRIRHEEATKKYRYRHNLFSIVGWSGFALGVTALLAGGAYAIAFLGPKERVEQSDRDTKWTDVKKDYVRARSYATNAMILGGVGGFLVLGGGATLYYAKKILKAPPPITPTLVPGPHSLSLSFTSHF